MLKVRVDDGQGTGGQARVLDDSLAVTVFPSPPLVPQKVRIFRQYLTSDGTSSGSSSMKVDASATAQEFYVQAGDDVDRYITTLSFVIADATATLNEFGAVTALTNGCQLFYEAKAGTVYIHDTLKSNWDFVRLCMGAPAFGDAAGAFRASNVVGTSEGYIPVLDLRRSLPPFGVKLDVGTKQRLVLEVRDDCSGVDGFNCIAYGFDRFK